MKTAVIETLRQLNRDFYGRLAEPFAASRARPQPGFQRLLAALPQSCHRVLDVGCGNGRFGEFLLAHHSPAIAYVGVDFSAELLARAQAALTAAARQGFAAALYQRDLSQPGGLAELGQFDLVACLAAMQHIPGRANRLRLLGEMKKRLTENGRIFLANWQFTDSARQQRKVRDWSEIGLSAADVEANDYLLTWQRDGFGLRYVCLIDAAETAVLAQEAGLRIVSQFRSDGQEGDLSLYTILTRE